MPKDTLVDARGHMLGRLASVLAKQLLNGEQIVSFMMSALGRILNLHVDLSLTSLFYKPSCFRAGCGQNRGDLHLWWPHQAEDEV